MTCDRLCVCMHVRSCACFFCKRFCVRAHDRSPMGMLACKAENDEKAPAEANDVAKVDDLVGNNGAREPDSMGKASANATVARQAHRLSLRQRLAKADAKAAAQAKADAKRTALEAGAEPLTESKAKATAEPDARMEVYSAESKASHNSAWHQHSQGARALSNGKLPALVKAENLSHRLGNQDWH